MLLILIHVWPQLDQVCSSHCPEPCQLWKAIIVFISVSYHVSSGCHGFAILWLRQFSSTRCCIVAHSSENRPQMVFPALCSCKTSTVLENHGTIGVFRVSLCVYSMPVHWQYCLNWFMCIIQCGCSKGSTFMKNLGDLHQSVVGSTQKDETKPVIVGQRVTIAGHCLHSTSS